MTPQQKQLRVLLNQRIVERSLLEPWEWCERNLHFNEAGNRGPFTTSGAEYVRDVLNDFGDSSVTDEVLVWGSQSRKTGTLMGGAAWCAVNDPCGFLWVMPSLTLAQKFSRQRWRKLLKASACIVPMIPTGAQRHDFSTLTQILASSVFNFVGSNSAANLSSTPCRRVILDEVDKFDSGDDREADAASLADQRTKGQTNAQRWRTSTPTTIGGLIWQSFLKGNQMRFFVPCPGCAKEIILAWSQQYTVFKLMGCEAFVRWDSKAKDEKTGDWDLEWVERTAHYKCPHCAEKITEVAALLPLGKWKATANAMPGFVSRHLPSLYSSMPECRVGKLAVKFLQAKRSVMGLRGFINGDLAEPDVGQETSSKRTELIQSSIIVTDEWQKIMVIDCQQKKPFFWFVIRAWGANGCHGMRAGSCETYEEVREIQCENKVQDVCVGIDSGFQARSGEAEVYRNCAAYGELLPSRDKLIHMGWMPMKGFPSRKRWKNPETKEVEPFYISAIDPYLGTSDAGQVSMNLFEFSSDFFKDILDNLRTRKTTFAQKYQWSAGDDMMEDMAVYWKHLDGQQKKTIIAKSGFQKEEWRPRGRYWPDHLLACEYGQIALAMFFGKFKNPMK